MPSNQAHARHARKTEGEGGDKRKEPENKGKRLHPEADLTTRSTSSHPVLAAVEGRCRWNCRDAVSSQLGQLIPRAAVHIDEAVHVGNAESLDL